MLRFSLFFLILVITVLPCSARETNVENLIRKPVLESIDILQSTQKAEEAWRTEKGTLAARFETLRQERAQLARQKEELQNRVASARTRIATKEKQLADIEQIAGRIKPFLNELMDELTLRISRNLPFLTEERSRRMETLATLMDDPDVSVSEKYRKVMEALLVEAEYGFTTEVGQETISVDGRDMLVNVFRLGRISLFFQSLDGSESGFFNVAEKKWKPLSAVHNAPIEAAIETAAGRRSVELLNVPVGRLVSP